MDSHAAVQAAMTFEAVVLAPMLRPLLAGAGFASGYELSLLAQDVAKHDRVFASVLAAQLGVTP